MVDERVCPHCGSCLGPWEAAPETGWGEILVCCNNDCSYFLESKATIENQGGSHRGYRYAEDPGNGYEAFPLVTWLSDSFVNFCQSRKL